MNIQFGQKYFKLYSCCIPVIGAKRSILCDLQRNDFIFLPNEFARIFSKKGSVTYQELQTEFIEYANFESEFLKFIKLLVKSEYGFYTDSPDLFPELNEDVYHACEISNAIIDIGIEITFDIKRFIKELSSCLCQSIAIRFFQTKSLNEIQNVIELFNDSTIRSIEIYLPFSEEIRKEQVLFELMRDFPICKSILVYGSDRNEQYRRDYNEISYTEYNMVLGHCCGHVSPYYFRINNQSFFEAKKFNNCLNKKISIDIDGRIRNCPSMKKDFGKYDDSKNLLDVLKLSAFSDVWHINKDQIEVCKDCEFRYICHDCRAFTVDENNVRSKPKHCKYDPYEAVWS